MPELPEIIVLAEQMNRELVGRRFSGVEIFQPKCLNLPPEILTERIVGLQVEQVYPPLCEGIDDLPRGGDYQGSVQGEGRGFEMLHRDPEPGCGDPLNCDIAHTLVQSREAPPVIETSLEYLD